MVRIRLRRVGLRNQPSYRIVVQDKESPRDGRFIEIIGFYNPRTEPATITLDEAKVYDWMSKGAQPTDSVAALLKSTGTLDRFARFKKGEALETLVAEAKAAESKRNSTSKTRKD
ncbi:MAG: 30S ribosomal protein S16 [Anaerolineae bacterium]|nr:MAG: 30S ribosomal protein S16 [Anaerolineae bacterium]